jgi:hypothetical protein
MTRRDLFKLGGAVLAAVSLLGPARVLVGEQPPPDSAYERMKRLRIDYMRAAGNPQRRFAINRDIVGLAFEMKAAGASRQHIMTIGQMSLCAAQHEYAALTG